MAKRDDSLAIATLRERGVDSRRVIGLLAATAGLVDRPEPTTPAALARRFDVHAVARDDSTLSDEDLRGWLHGE
jgi:glutamyl-tRNA synthetase